MGNEALWDAIRRSVEERNSDPEKMRRWLEDWEDRWLEDWEDRWLEDWEDRYDDYGGEEVPCDE